MNFKLLKNHLHTGNDLGRAHTHIQFIDALNLAIAAPRCKGITYNRKVKTAYLHTKIVQGKIVNDENPFGPTSTKHRWHDLVILTDRQ